LPTLLLEQQAVTDPASAALLARIRDDAGDDSPEADADLQLAIAELYAHPVTQATRTEARRWASEAVAALAPLPAGAVKQALSAFAEHVVSRTA
jgi:heptaprenyl diphosphate synthase